MATNPSNRIRVANQLGHLAANEIFDAIDEVAAGTLSTDVISATTSVTTPDLTVTDDATIEGSLIVGDGSSNYYTITGASTASDRAITLPDPGGSAEIVLTAGTQSIPGTKTFTTRNTAVLAATSQIVLNGTAANGAAAVRTFVAKQTGIVDAAATTIFEVSVPNANHSAAIKLTFLAAVDNFHSARVAEGLIVVCRDADDDTVAVVATLELAQIATGGTETLTLAYSVTSMTGAAGATQTFNIQVTLNTSNSSAAQIVAVATIINSEATGITMGTP